MKEWRGKNQENYGWVTWASERETTKGVYEASYDVIEARMVCKTEGYGDAQWMV